MNINSVITPQPGLLDPIARKRTEGVTFIGTLEVIIRAVVEHLPPARHEAVTLDDVVERRAADAEVA